MPDPNKSVTPAEQYLRIQEVFRTIPFDGTISLLTGRNGSGKSLIRAQLHHRLKREKGEEYALAHASMALRASINPIMGALSSMTLDDSDMPTSYSTLRTIEKAIRYIEDAKGKGYLVIDEMELGCGEETQLALVQWLNDELLRRNLPLGALLITHSRLIVAHLQFDNFFNLDSYQTVEEWLNRPIIPTNLDELRENKLYSYIRDASINNKKKGQ